VAVSKALWYTVITKTKQEDTEMKKRKATPAAVMTIVLCGVIGACSTAYAARVILEHITLADDTKSAVESAETKTDSDGEVIQAEFQEPSSSSYSNLGAPKSIVGVQSENPNMNKLRIKGGQKVIKLAEPLETAVTFTEIQFADTLARCKVLDHVFYDPNEKVLQYIITAGKVTIDGIYRGSMLGDLTSFQDWDDVDHVYETYVGRPTETSGEYDVSIPRYYI
jgi:hypothetical protein